ncbi:MAG: YdcF family protein [Myxococcales bacterium]
MFFWLSKTFDIFTSPPFLVLVLALLAARNARRGNARGAWRFAIAGGVLLYGLSVPLLADPLLTYTEENDGHPYDPRASYDAVIVLGGFLGRDLDYGYALSEPGERLLRGFEAFRSGKTSLVILSGGGFGDEVEADLMAKLLTEWGVPRDRLLLDRDSLNTRENALGVQRIVERHGLRRLLLVTSAFHMQRALDCFRALGLEPDVLPCDFQAPGTAGWFWTLAPRAGTLAVSEIALRELLGRLVYRGMGYAKPGA